MSICKPKDEFQLRETGLAREANLGTLPLLLEKLKIRDRARPSVVRLLGTQVNHLKGDDFDDSHYAGILFQR